MSVITPDEAPRSRTVPPVARRPARTRAKPRKRVQRSIIVTHRWASLTLGLLLVVITTTGAIVLYTPEWQRWTHSDVYSASAAPATVTAGQALDVVRQAHPELGADTINVFGGVYEVGTTTGSPTVFGVDPSDGRITGSFDRNRGFMGLMNQIHECFFACEEYPGHIPFLLDDVPTLGTSFLIGITWSSLLLGVGGLLLLFLAVSGAVLWWPGIRRWTHGFRVRTSKGRFARDYDLHQVIGMVAVPFLLMWALTGTNFEFPGLANGWYALTGGTAVPDSRYEFESVVPESDSASDISVDDAVAAAESVVSGPVANVYPPEADDPAGYFGIYIAEGNDPWEHGPYPGDRYVAVDRYDATHTALLVGDSSSLSNRILDEWSTPYGHYGFGVNGWWRIIWFVFGSTPLVLMITGLSTWFYKRGVTKNKKAARAARAAAV
ncbi:hypothetical protein CH302_20380 [Rhodococcus sp. 15-2388-1-1a]|uniref:PepSY-associated TM helix domain-containing protein n=1 Tax=Nocardiaceae TaxID=85025 RepID=UPI00068EA70B|nr:MULTISPECIES: PepSY-associated TM helix domain-containing protein [Rhodococcus]OZE94246.1 hypothetical protein CH302_20380 [Rhodococcus sp. 15-2388-1-1a]